MSKIKIAFDITDTWQYSVFRELINDFLVEDEFYEVFLITKDPDTAYVTNVVAQMGVNPNNVYQETTNTGIITRLNTLSIEIYLSADNQIVEDINDNTVTKAILVNETPDRYKMQPMYFTNLQFWINQLNKIDGKSNVC